MGDKWLQSMNLIINGIIHQLQPSPDGVQNKLCLPCGENQERAHLLLMRKMCCAKFSSSLTGQTTELGPGVAISNNRPSDKGWSGIDS